MGSASTNAKKKGGNSKSSAKPAKVPAKVPSANPVKKAVKVSKEEFVPPSVALSARDRAPQLKLSKDQLEVCGAGGGFRMVRATHGVHNGAYYCEVEILPPDTTTLKTDETQSENNVPDSHIRLGWSTRQGDLQAPLGHDKHGCSYRNVSGSKVNSSTRDDSYGESYGPGDIIGLYLKMDLEQDANNEMRFFKNGLDQGVAFRGKDIPLGVYFPAIAVYQFARARINFGPSFILQHDIYGANALSEVQPMNPQDRREHEQRIRDIRAERLCGSASASAVAAVQGGSDDAAKPIITTSTSSSVSTAESDRIAV